MFYRNINILLSRTLSIDEIFSSFARDFDLDTSKIIRVFVTLLKKRSIKNENIENQRQENIENSIENNEISESNERKRNHRNYKDDKNVKNRNQDN
jgi:hypothetical protein